MEPSKQQTQISALIADINIAAESAKKDLLRDEAARAEVLRASRRLSAALEKPEDAASGVAFLPVYSLCARVAVELRIFSALSESEYPLSAYTLAKLSSSDPLLIVRIMRPLSAMNFVEETDSDTYTATSITRAMAVPSIAAGHIHLWDQCVASLAKFPSYLSRYGNKCPTSFEDGAFQHALGTNLETFTYWSQYPKVIDNFNTFMSASRSARPNWIDWFPVQTQIIDGFQSNEEDVLLIDVAGGRGHDLVAFQTRFPKLRGRLILEDLPDVIDDIKSLDASVERVKYDFFTPQPHKGARAYFFHFIFHDWSDPLSLKILQNTISAMKPGYSKILINDFILPNKDCPLVPAAIDLCMMALHSGLERTENQWLNLLQSAGVHKEDVKFWLPPGVGEGIIEIQLQQ